MLKVAVLVSSGGTNLQAIIDASQRGELPHAEIGLVISSKPDAFALQRAEKAGIAAMVLPRKEYAEQIDFDKALLQQLQANNIDVVVLAGFLCILGDCVIDAYAFRMINVHPSLIPSFCGAGFYGLKVHEAALARGVKVSGATVHYVNHIVDGGEIILQKAVDIYPDDTAKTLQKRVMEQAEWVILPQALELVCKQLEQA